MKRMVLKPIYFDEFKCVGSKCEDTCCAGWRIDIDKKTYKNYMKCRNIEMRKKLKKNISRNRKISNDIDYARFNLVNGVCPFLNKDNLCDIYINIGQENMCYTCTVYPRLYTCVNEIFQLNLCLSCIEVAKLVLSSKESIKFDLVEEDIKESRVIRKLNSNLSEKITEVYFEEIREFSIDLIQNRKFSIEERLIILGLFCKNVGSDERISDLILKYNSFIEKGYYENILEKINLQNMVDTQFSLLVLLYENIVLNGFVFNERYMKIIQNVIDGLKLIDDINESKKNFINIYNIYNEFIKGKEYIYENYLVAYILNELFPYDIQDNIVDSYISLVIKFVIIKLNIIGLCSYYKNDMNEKKLIDTIQIYSKVMLHNIDLNDKIYSYLKENDMNTINHMILMIGK